MRASDGTVTPAEAAVLAVLKDGPCATSGHTELGGRYRFVELRVCKALARAGLVSIDAGGWARLTAQGEEAVRG